MIFIPSFIDSLNILSEKENLVRRKQDYLISSVIIYINFNLH
jgi:hypothetical protein